MSHLTHWLLLALVAFSAASLAAEPTRSPATENARIEALIGSVEQAKGLVFIRNGEEHDGTAAASHLRLKWKNAGRRVRTAEDFIRYCATGSSSSGRKYQIRFADGKIQDSADYFQAQLRRIDAATPAPAPKPVASKPG